MSSKAVVGMPGGSKSYYTTAFAIWEELLKGNRKIVTNVPLRLGNLQKSLDKRGRSDIRVADRIELLPYEEVGEFWRHRGPGVELLPAITAAQAKEGKRPDFDLVSDNGVLYVLDELHEHLNSRAWKDTGPVVLFYIAKHRHLGDDVYWITQAPKNVDSQWRSVTHEYIYCRNYGMEKFGMFSKGQGMEAVAYLEMFTGSQTPQWTKRYTLNRESCNWYYTSVYKGSADKGRKIGGLPIWTLFLALAAAGVLFYYGSGAVVSAFVDRPDAEKPATVTASAPPATGPQPATVGTAKPERLGVDLDSLEKELPLTHLLAVPLRYSTADRVLESFAKDPNPQTGTTITANAANSGILVQGNSLQDATIAAQKVRQYDIASAQIAVHCLIARRTLAKGSEMGLFGLLQDVAKGSKEGGRQDLVAAFSDMVLDLSTGLTTFGGTWSARVALDAFTQFVATDSQFEVMSRPVLVVNSGRSATFASGRDIPVPVSNSTSSGVLNSVEYKKAQFSYEVLPTLLGSGMVQLDIKQSNADVIGTALIAGSQLPTLATQSLTSSVTMTDKQMLYLGGIMIETNAKEDKGTPYLRKVPVLNWIVGRGVKQTEKSELFVIFTVEVYKPGDGPVRVMKAIPVTAKESKRARASNSAAGAVEALR